MKTESCERQHMNVGKVRNGMKMGRHKCQIHGCMESTLKVNKVLNS